MNDLTSMVKWNSQLLRSAGLASSLGFEKGHGRLIDKLEPAQIFDVHIALAAGYEKAHRIAIAGMTRSPFWWSAIITSSNASFIGTLRDSPNESAPSARIHFALGSMRLRQARSRAARRSIRRSTKGRESLRSDLHRLAREHGRRVSGALEEMHARHHRIARQRFDGVHHGCFTRPWMTSLCWAGSMSQTGMQMLKNRLFGVTVPCSRWCGVRAWLLRSSFLGLLSVRTTPFSKRDAVCRVERPRPSPGSTGRS